MLHMPHAKFAVEHRRRLLLACALAVLLAAAGALGVAGASTLGITQSSRIPNFFPQVCNATVETATVGESATVTETYTISCANAVRRHGR